MKPNTLSNQGLFFLLFYFALNLFFSSCSQNPLSIRDYIQYVRTQENGLMNSVEKDGYILTAMYEPADYVTLKELRNNKITREEFLKTKSKFSDYYYFDFYIKSDGTKLILDPNDSSSYTDRFQHFSFDLAGDIYLRSNQDTLHCLLYQFIPSNGISPEYHFEMMFEKPDSSFLNLDTILFSYEDKILHLGTVNIPFKISNLKKVPEIKI